MLVPLHGLPETPGAADRVVVEVRDAAEGAAADLQVHEGGDRYGTVELDGSLLRRLVHSGNTEEVTLRGRGAQGVLRLAVLPNQVLASLIRIQSRFRGRKSREYAQALRAEQARRRTDAAAAALQDSAALVRAERLRKEEFEAKLARSSRSWREEELARRLSQTPAVSRTASVPRTASRPRLQVVPLQAKRLGQPRGQQHRDGDSVSGASGASGALTAWCGRAPEVRLFLEECNLTAYHAALTGPNGNHGISELDELLQLAHDDRRSAPPRCHRPSPPVPLPKGFLCALSSVGCRCRRLRAD